MRRTLVMVGVWALGVAVAVGVAFAAVDRVASGLTPKDGARLSRAAIDNEIRRPASGSAGATRPAPTGGRSTSSSTPTTRAPSVTSPTVSTTTGVSPPTTPTTTTIPPPPPATTPATGTTPTTAPAETASSSAPTSNTLTTSEGGTLFTRCSGPERIVFVAAVPKSGYQRTVDDESPGGIRQSFQNASHRSNIEAECSNGIVHAQVEEESTDS